MAEVGRFVPRFFEKLHYLDSDSIQKLHKKIIVTHKTYLHPAHGSLKETIEAAIMRSCPLETANIQKKFDPVSEQMLDRSISLSNYTDTGTGREIVNNPGDAHE